VTGELAAIARCTPHRYLCLREGPRHRDVVRIGSQPAAARERDVGRIGKPEPDPTRQIAFIGLWTPDAYGLSTSDPGGRWFIWPLVCAISAWTSG
jgi:hypothetical protein